MGVLLHFSSTIFGVLIVAPVYSVEAACSLIILEHQCSFCLLPKLAVCVIQAASLLNILLSYTTQSLSHTRQQVLRPVTQQNTPPHYYCTVARNSNTALQATSSIQTKAQRLTMPLHTQRDCITAHCAQGTKAS
jgi:hypothetical protein